VLSGPTPAGCLSAGRGELLPYVTLATPSGAPVALGQYSGRRNLVVVLLGAGSPGEIVARLLTQLVHARARLDNDALPARMGRSRPIVRVLTCEAS